MSWAIRTVAAVIVLLAGLALGTGGALAQQGGNSTQANATQPSGEYIDSNTELVDTQYNPDAGTVMVTLKSETRQTVEIYDAGGFWTEDDIATRTVRLAPGEQTRVRLAVTEQSGRVGVGIDTEETIHPVILQRPNNDLTFVNRLTSLESLAIGSTSAFIWFVLSGVYVLYIEGGEPEVA